MIKKDIKNSYSKICGISYTKKDINRIINFAKKHKLNYFVIKHIKEKDELKNHFHFIIEGDSKHRFNIGILVTDTQTINLFEKCTSVDSYLRYMLHLDFVDKKHYSSCDIISNITEFDIDIRVNYDTRTITEINNFNFNLIINSIINGELNSLRDIYIFCNDNNIQYKTVWTFTFLQFLKK